MAMGMWARVLDSMAMRMWARALVPPNPQLVLDLGWRANQKIGEMLTKP